MECAQAGTTHHLEKPMYQTHAVMRTKLFLSFYTISVDPFPCAPMAPDWAIVGVSMDYIISYIIEIQIWIR
jgi:hypothetical protein